MKLSYSQVYLEVDKIYNQNMDLTTSEEIDELCEKVQAFIVSCGWQVDDFVYKMVLDVNENYN